MWPEKRLISNGRSEPNPYLAALHQRLLSPVAPWEAHIRIMCIGTLHQRILSPVAPWEAHIRIMCIGTLHQRLLQLVVLYGKHISESCALVQSTTWSGQCICIVTFPVSAWQAVSRASRPPSMGGPAIDPPANSFSAPQPFQPATPFGQVVSAFGSHPSAAPTTPSPAFGTPFQRSPAESMPSAGPFDGKFSHPRSDAWPQLKV